MAFLDTRMGYNTPDEGLVGGRSVRKDFKRRGDDESTKVRLERRKMQLNIDRMTWFPNWRDLSDNFLPSKGRWMVNDAWDTNKGWRRNWAIVDSTPLMANSTCAAGLMAGTASEARPWFAYELTDNQLLEAPGVKEWLAEVTDRTRDLLSRTNFYNALAECFREYAVFGVMALGREWRDPKAGEDDLPHFQPHTIGSYYIAQDRNRRVNTWFRDFRWTVQQVVDKFATGPLDEEKSWENISLRTRGLWKQGQKDQWIDCVHAIEENQDYRPGALGLMGMRFRSIYYERGGEPEVILKDDAKKSVKEKSEERRFLRTGGFRDFPVFVARWYTNSEDCWGRGPAMDALGDARALQFQQKRKAQAIDKLVDPPMVASPEMRNQRTSMLPGDVTYSAMDGNHIGFKPAYEIRPDIGALGEDIRETQDRIKEIMNVPLFAQFLEIDQNAAKGQKMTAAEVNARQQEKLLLLGPVLGQMNFDLFDPLHDWLFAECLRHGKYPPMPQALHKATVRVKYISILAQAINAVKAQALTQVVQFVTEIAQVSANAGGSPALDKVDFDEMIEEYADAVGASPKVIRSDADVEQVRHVRQQQQEEQQKAEQQAQAAQAMESHAGAAKTLSETKMGQGSALDALAQQLGAGQVANQ